jgi:DNA-directed RNA polymerase II subunit RPB2
MICPAETPEGQACGLVKNLSLMAFVSVGWSPQKLITTLFDFGVEPLNISTINILKRDNVVKVFVNGTWIGCHTNPHSLE